MEPPLGRAARLYLVHIALLTVSLSIVGLLFNLAILAFGFSIDFLGVLNTVSFSASVLFSLPLLWLLGRLPLRFALIVSAGFQVIGVALLALWPQTAGLLIASALLGTAAVLFDISAAPFMMRHSTDATRDQLFSANTAIRVGLGGVGSLFGGQLPALAALWLEASAQSPLAYRVAFLVAVLGLALALVPLLLIGRSAPPKTITAPAEKSPSGVWALLLRKPGPLITLMISPVLISFGAALLVPYLNLFFKQRFETSDQMLGLIFAGLGICTGLAALAAPRLSARIGKMPTIVLTEALGIPFLLVLGFAPLLGIAVGAALARAALFNMATPLYDAFAMETSSEEARPTIIALLNGAYSIGYLGGPLLSTYIQSYYGFTPVFLCTACCYTLAVWAKYQFFIRHTRFG